MDVWTFNIKFVNRTLTRDEWYEWYSDYRFHEWWSRIEIWALDNGYSFLRPLIRRVRYNRDDHYWSRKLARHARIMGYEG